MDKFFSVLLAIFGFILAVLGSIATLISAVISGYGVWTILGYGLGFAVATPILGLIGVLLGMLVAFIGALIVELA